MGDHMLLAADDYEIGFLFPEEPEDNVERIPTKLLQQLNLQPGQNGHLHDFDFSTEVQRLIAAIPPNDPMFRAKHSVDCSPLKIANQEDPFELQQIPCKGFGLIATRPIPAGTTLINEPYIISVLEPSQDKLPESKTRSLVLVQLLGQYAKLPASVRQQVSQLHFHIPAGTYEQWLYVLRDCKVETPSPDLVDFVVRLYRTFHTNEFTRHESGGWKSRWLFPFVSRINHSCSSNCRLTQTTDGRKVVATAQEIAAGEELTFRYVDFRRFGSRAEWGLYTQDEWGFVCSCEGCNGA